MLAANVESILRIEKWREELRSFIKARYGDNSRVLTAIASYVALNSNKDGTVDDLYHEIEDSGYVESFKEHIKEKYM